MGFDVADIFEVLAFLKEIEELLKKHKPLIDKVIHKGATTGGGSAPTDPVPPKPIPVPIPNEPQEPNPKEPPRVPDKSPYKRLALRIFFNERNGQTVPLPQMVKDRLHFDISPFDENDEEIRTGDPRHIIVPGDVPLRYRWWRDGKLNTHAEYSGLPAEEDDHWQLESVRDRDNGFTPVLELLVAESGGHKCQMEAFVPAEFNGGLEVVSNRVEWTCD